MIRGAPLTAVIPVRGGSRGVPGKNLYQLGGQTLLERTIRMTMSSDRIDRTIVSTDSPEMHEIARQHGVESDALRPSQLATETASTVDVVLHELDQADIARGFVLLLQVTTPLRTTGDLQEFFSTFEANQNSESIVSLAAHDAPHPDKIQTIRDGFVESYLGVESMVARQKLPKVYKLNGAFYLTSVASLRSGRSFLPSGSTIPFIMPEERSINIDTPFDLVLLQALVEKKIVTLENYD